MSQNKNLPQRIEREKQKLKEGITKFCWLVVSTHLKNISQMGNLPQIVLENKKYLSYHHQVLVSSVFRHERAIGDFG